MPNIKNILTTKSRGSEGGSLPSEFGGLTMVLNLIADGSVECDEPTKEHYVAKARHALRHPKGVTDAGRFRRESDHEEIPLGLGTHSGAVHPMLKRALGFS